MADCVKNQFSGVVQIEFLENVCSVCVDGAGLLVVDDDEDARLLLTEMLEYDGAHMLPATSAAEAITLLEQQHPDVLLSDLRMPGEDGFALI